MAAIEGVTLSERPVASSASQLMNSLSMMAPSTWLRRPCRSSRLSICPRTMRGDTCPAGLDESPVRTTGLTPSGGALSASILASWPSPRIPHLFWPVMSNIGVVPEMMLPQGGRDVGSTQPGWHILPDLFEVLGNLRVLVHSC